MVQLFMAAVLAAGAARYAGESGARRYNALPDERARAEQEVFATRVFDWLLLFNIALSAVDAGLATYLGSWVEAAIALGTLTLSWAAWSLVRSARSNVNACFAERGLEPLHPRESSLRRKRRQTQFAVLAAGGYLSGRVLIVVSEQTGETWLAIPAAVAMVVAFTGVLALVWSMAWRFGDERPV
jgi:hypothetical protein